MNEVQQNTSDKKIDKAKKASRQRKQTEFDDFKFWLATLGMVSVPALHMNGPNYAMAVLTVDFGTPLEEPNKFTAEQSADLVGKMKTITRSLFKNEVNVRVQNDSSNGVWWSSIN